MQYCLYGGANYSAIKKAKRNGKTIVYKKFQLPKRIPIERKEFVNKFYKEKNNASEFRNEFYLKKKKPHSNIKCLHTYFSIKFCYAYKNNFSISVFMIFVLTA